MTSKLEGQVSRVLAARNPDVLESMAEPTVKVSLEGFEGDNHAGFTMRSNARQPHFPRGTLLKNSRQVSLVSEEELAEIATRMGISEILPEWLGANLCLTGLPNLTQLPPGSRLFFPQQTVLVVEGENIPCSGPARVIQAKYPAIKGLRGAFVKAAWKRRGLVGWVERGGLISAGERVRVELAPPVVYPVPAI